MADRVNKFLLLLVIGLSARLLYIFLFHDCYSVDVHAWNGVAEVLMAGGNPYNLTSALNWPPLWMQLVFCFKKISLATYWPFVDVVRGFLILVESALMLALYVTVIRFTGFKKPATLLMLGIVLNPISILQVCQHCNFDVMVGFWILLAVAMLLRFHEQHEPRFWLCACFALGMGALTKTVPLCLAPLLLPFARRLKSLEQILGAVLLLLPMTLGLSIVYVLGPGDIETKVLSYRSVAGHFGFTGLFMYFHTSGLLAIWPYVFIITYGLAWICLGIWLWFRNTLAPLEIVVMAATLLLAIPTLGPGYGPQYVYWFLPLFVLMYGLAGRQLRIFLLALYGIAALTFLIEYAFDFNTLGGFFLEVIPIEKLSKFGLKLSSPAGDTFLRLPLWMFYLTFVTFSGIKIGQMMLSDLRTMRRQS